MARPQRNLLLLALPLLVLGAVGVLLLGGDPPAEPSALGGGLEGPAAGPASDGGEVAELTGPGPAAGGDSPEAAVRSIAEDDFAAAEDPDAPGRARARVQGKVPRDSHWVEGRVTFPDGTPLDEEIRVVAGGRRFRTLRGQPEEYMGAVDREGRFRVAFANGTRKGRLWVDAKYAYMSRPVVVDPTAEEEIADVVLEPSLGGRLEVEVVPPRVALGDASFYDEVTVEVRADQRWSQVPPKDGLRLEENRFAVGGLDPDTTLLAEARHPEYANGETKGIEVVAGETQFVVVSFDLGATIAGEILNAEGERIPQARVLAMTTEQASRRNPFMNEKVDEQSEEGDGSFALEGVPAGEMVLIIEADGYLEGRYELGEVRNGERREGLQVRLDRGNLVAGVVQWPDGSPARGALVRISQRGGFGGWDVERIMGETKVGEDGRFQFSALLDGMCQLQASSFERGYEPPADASLRERLLDPPPLWRAVAADVNPGTLNLVMDLSEGTALAGRVVDETGEPVRSFQIIATPSENDILSTSARKAVKDRFRAKDGSFVLEGLPLGKWVVTARGLGYGDGAEVEVSAPRDEPVEIVLPRECQLAGKVLDPDGKPVEDVWVTVEHGAGNTARTQSGEEGAFSAPRLNPGVAQVSASGGGWAKSSPVEVVLAAGEERDDLVVYLRRGGELTVLVHPAAAPIAGRSVQLNGSGWRMEETDADGKVVFKGLDPGDYEVTLQPAGGDDFGGRGWMQRMANQKKVKVSLADQQRVQVVLGEPSPTAVQVTGRVTSGGEPVGNAALTVTLAGGGDPVAAIQADASGAYSVMIDEPGEYRFLVGRDWQSQSVFTREVPAGASHSLDFELPTLSISGVVRGAGGELVAEATLTLTPDANNGQGGNARFMGVRRVTSDAGGGYVFPNVSPGSYTIRVADSRRGDQRAGHLLREGVVLGEEALVLDLDLPPAGGVEGTCRDGAGQPIGRARIEVTAASGVSLRSFSRDFSRPGGAYSLEGLPAGEVFVEATQGGRSSGRVSVQVPAGGKASLDLVLE
jgi:hypothetical protein